MLAERRSNPMQTSDGGLGALRWDLAQHGEGAEDAFFRALKHVGDEGPFQYLSDVIGRLGAERGLELAMSRTERSAGHRDQSSQAELLTCIARRALEDSQQEAALTAALRALELTPNAPQVPLAIIECLWAHPRAADVIERAFKVIEKNAIGKVGRMTARHRAERWRSWLQGEEGSVPPPRKSSANLAETATAGPSTEPTRVVELPEHSLRGLVWGDHAVGSSTFSPETGRFLRRLAGVLGHRRNRRRFRLLSRPRQR